MKNTVEQCVDDKIQLENNLFVSVHVGGWTQP